MEDAVETLVFRAAESGDLTAIRNLFGDEPAENVKIILGTLTDDLTPLIIACNQGHFEIVEYLIEECNADIEQIGSASIDDDEIQGLTPLWCAAASGHLDIVQKLIFHNARINAATTENLTPLFAACDFGHYEIVKYLCENGADLNAANQNGDTCLIITSADVEALEVAHYLIERGADINIKNMKGLTALFAAVESGNSDFVKMLVDLGAETQVVYRNMTPLLYAAVKGNVSIVKYFMKNVPCTLMEEISAYELLGAAFVEVEDLRQGCEYWKKAMTIRHKNVDSPILKPVNVPPVDAYNNVTEVNTYDQVESISNSPDDMYMQSLLIKERIIGRANLFTIRYIRDRGLKYSQTGNWERCIQLWFYSFSIEQDTFEPLSTIVIHNIFHLVAIFYNEMYDDKSNFRGVRNTHFYKLLTMLQQTVHEIHRALQCAVIDEDDFHDLLVSAMHFMGFLYELLPQLSIEEELEVRNEIATLIHWNPESYDGWTLLHIACSNQSPLSLHDAIFPFPAEQVVKLLLKYGASPQMRDYYGNTPLHIVAMKMPNHKDILKLLLDNGAHIDFRNKSGKTILDILNPADLGVFPFHYFSLKCFCTQVIHKAKIPFRGEVPETLEEFLDAH